MPRPLLVASLGLFTLSLLLLAAAELSSDGQLTGPVDLQSDDGSSSGSLSGEGAARRLTAAARSQARSSSSDGSPPAQCVSYSGGDSVQLLSATTGEVVGWASLGSAAPAFTPADDPLLPNVTAPGYSSQASGLAQRNASYSGVFRNPRMRFNISLLSGRHFAGAAAPAAPGRGAVLNGGPAAGVHQLTAAVRDPGAANLKAYTFTDQPSSCPIAEMHFAQEAALPCAATAAAVDVDLPTLFGCSADANGGQPFSMGLFLQLSVRTAASSGRACAAGAGSSSSAWSWAFGQDAPTEVMGSGGVVVEVEEGVEQRPECAFFQVVATCTPAACGDARPPPPSPEPRPPRPRRNMPVANGATRAPPPAPPVPAPLAPVAAAPAPSPPSPRPPPRRAPSGSGSTRAPPMPPFPVTDFDSTSPPQYPPLSVADGPLAADVRAPPPSPEQARPSPAPGPAPPAGAPGSQPAPSSPATAGGSTQPPAAPSPDSPEVIITFMPPPPHRTTEGGGFGGGATGTSVGGGGFGGSRTATVSGTTDGGGAAATTGGSGGGSGTMKPVAIAGVAAGAAVAGVAVIGVAALVISGKVAGLFAATGSSALAAITAAAGVSGASAAVAAGTAAPTVGFAAGGGASAAAAAAGREGWYFAIGRRATSDSEASSEADPHSTRVSMNGAFDGADGAAAASSPGGASTATASSGHTACTGQEPMVAMLMASISLPLANDGRQELW
ncbi:hypothetical protein HXX76_008958 [Chlamydomonas incerta]|uniref:Pherophorin domain-containing protein n=1 Tax=Chlamydomonas incerta TaxID=51695 RepID=A0A835SYX9_CHLIN|nr:hypothetical protein HXX76_008958 [Chlamydomonas incerta]|eukprot:KAG2432618.1 hypothetical protein HXX76_008958 [Chlamydomonas incerta]